MAIATDITIKNAANADVTFKLIERSTGFFRYHVPSSDGQRAKAFRLTVAHKEPKVLDVTGFAIEKVVLTLPILQSMAPDVMGKPATVAVEFVKPNGMTVTARAELYALAINALQHVLLKGQLKDDDILV